MAAPMIANNAMTKKIARNLIVCNILTVLILTCLIHFIYKGIGQFDLLNNAVTAIKLLVVSVLVLHSGSHLVLGYQRPKLKLNIWFKDLLKCFGVFFVSILMFHGLAVMFGAPFTQQTTETFHFAMLLASAAVGPLLIHLETNTDTWFRVIVMQSPEKGLETTAYLCCVCSILGAWLGAVPIPLDWDRPWQVWPITCVLGTLVGHCVGIIFSTLYTSVQFYKANKFKIT